MYTLLFISILVNRTYSQCREAITEILVLSVFNTTALLDELLPYLYLSGKGINNYGAYDQCIRNYNYADLQVYVPQAPITGNIGICLSKSCSIDELNGGIHYFRHFIEIAIHRVFNVYYCILCQRTITGYDIILHDPTIPRPPMKIMGYIIILLACLLIAFSLGVTYVNWDREIVQRDSLRINQLSTMAEIDEKKQIVMARMDLRVNWEECCSPSGSRFEVLNFIRVIGFLMCLFADVGISALLQTDFVQVLHYMQHLVLLVVFGCLYCVEIFLWLGGFFAVLSMSKQNCFIAIVNRVCKIWPLLILVLMTNQYLVPHMGDGPRWFYAERYSQCTLWWQNGLFISNLFDENTCSMWLWYISLDMQMFVVCAFIMAIYKRSKDVAKAITVVLLTLSQTLVLYTCFSKKYGIPYYALQSTDIYQAFYYRPWFRAPPYFIGMLVGICYLETRLRMSIGMRIALQLGGFLIILYLTVGWYDTMQFGEAYYPEWLQYTYEGTMRILYAIAITMYTLPNIMGYSDWYSRIQNNLIVRYTVKFTFSGYLVHYLLVEVLVSRFYESIDFNVQNVMQLFIGIGVFIGIASFAFRLVFEQPITAKQRHIIPVVQKQE